MKPNRTIRLEIHIESHFDGRLPLLIGIGLLFILIGCNSKPQKSLVEKATVVQSYPHDSNAFTQGLVLYHGELYEGTGQYGKSSLRNVDLQSGKIKQKVDLSAQYFGEGITVFNDKIYQLTWQDYTCFVYDLKTFQLMKKHTYTFEGWGITHNGKEIIVSDGTAFLRFLDPDTFDEVRRVPVIDRGEKLNKINELEYIRDEVWANVWYQDRIVRIDPKTGGVLGWIDASEVYPKSRRNTESVLNGIAYDSDSNRLFITGKNWPQLFEIRTESLSVPK